MLTNHFGSLDTALPSETSLMWQSMLQPAASWHALIACLQERTLDNSPSCQLFKSLFNLRDVNVILFRSRRLDFRQIRTLFFLLCVANEEREKKSSKRSTRCTSLLAVVAKLPFLSSKTGSKTAESKKRFFERSGGVTIVYRAAALR
jgi:hypothetical protein